MRRSRRSSSNATNHDNIPTTTSATTATRCSHARSPRLSLTQPDGTTRRPSLLVAHRTVAPSASLNSAFWSSTSSDPRSTTSSLQSVSTLRGGGAAAVYGKAVISRTSSAGPPAGLTMRGIQEEDAEFWQLLQHQQQETDDDVQRGDVGIGRRSPAARLQASVFSRSCPCLSLAAVGLQAMRLERDGELESMSELSPVNDDVDSSKHRRLRSRHSADPDHH